MNKFYPPRYVDDTFIPKVGDELEWGLRGKTEADFNANCGRHRVVVVESKLAWGAIHVSGPVHILGNGLIFL